MHTAAKLIYGTQAVFFTGSGLFYLYAAGAIEGEYIHWFGVDAFVWVGVAHLLTALAWWGLLLVRPDLLAGK